jgi:hypothetical protein
MSARRARRSLGEGRPTWLSAGPLLVVAAAAAICGFTLYWSQSRLEAASARLDRLEHSVEAATGQYAAGQPGQTDSSSASTGGAYAASGPARLARIVECSTAGNLVTVDYDPAQLFTGPDAVSLAASHGVAVTGDTYLFDPTSDIFAGQAPITAAVTVQEAPAGWTGPLPTTVAELATALQAPGGQVWLQEYFSLRFNQGYIVGIDQVPLPAAP